MNKIKSKIKKIVILVMIILGLLLFPLIGAVRAAVSSTTGSSIIVYVTGRPITELVTEAGRFFGEGVVDGKSVFLSCFEHITQKAAGIFYSLFCSGQGVRLSSDVGKTDYSTGLPVGYIPTSIADEYYTDDGWPLALLYEVYFTAETTVGHNNDEYKVIINEDTKEDEDEAIEAGLDLAIEKAENEIFGPEITTVTFGYYSVNGPDKATPAEAYVLTEMLNNTDNHSYVQIAWWRVKTESNSSSGTPSGDGNEGAVEEDNKYDEDDDDPDNIYRPPEDETITDNGTALYEEAMAFQGYILEVAGASTGAEMKNRYNGDVFDIDYADVVEEIDTSDVDVLYDSKTNTYRIGPMSVNYVRAGAQYGERDAIDFAGISNAKMKVRDVDGTTREMTLDQSYYNGTKGFRIVYDHERDMRDYDVNDYADFVQDENLYYPYPYPDEEFYIEIDYMDDIASVEEFRFDFHWMNGGAEYEDLMTCEAYIVKWEVTAEYIRTVNDNDGDCAEHEWCTNHSDSDNYHWKSKNDCHEHEHESYDIEYNVYARYESHDTIKSQEFINGRYSILADFNPNYGGDAPNVGGNQAIYVTAGGWDLTTEVAGFAWVEGITYEKGVVVSTGDSKWVQPTQNNGQEDSRKPNIEIRIMRVVYNKNGDSYSEVSRELAKAYKTKTVESNGTITLTDEYNWGSNRLYTDSNGEYKAYLKIPSVENKTENQIVSYDIEFIYDGQTYETVEYLVSSEKDSIEDKLAELQNVTEEAKTTGVIDYSKFKDDSYVIESSSESATNTPVASGRNEIPLGRPNFDYNYEEIYGESPIDDSKNTVGKASGDDGEKELNYTGQMYSEFLAEVGDSSGVSGDEDRIVTSLKTTNDSDYVLEQYQLASRTSTGSLLLPYVERIYIRHYSDGTATEDLNEYAQLSENKGEILDDEESWYFPVYEYFHQINLGLIKREDADITVSKDLYKSEVIVNQQEVTYKYSTLRDYENEDNEEYLNTLLEIQNIHQKYELGLYAADFYYRSSVYEEAGTTVGQRISDWKEGSELKMYATYKLSVYNDSDTADMTVNEIIDYYDSSFTLVDSDQYADVIDSEGHKYSKLVAEQPYYRIYSILESDLSNSIYHYNSKEDISEDSLSRASVNSRGVVQDKIAAGAWTLDNNTYGDGAYKKATLSMFSKDSNNEDFKLSPGEKIELFVTYEIDQEGYNAATGESYTNASERTNLLGVKNNVVEVGNYSTFYTAEGIRYNTSAYKEGDIAGIVDSDSAPDNVNFNKTVTDEDGDVTLNKKWFDDDVDSAPVYRIYIREGEKERQIDGTVWKDEDSNDIDGLDTATANGIYDSGESGIEGITVSLVEKVRIPTDMNSGGGTYLEYDFVWPNNISSVMDGYNPVTNTDSSGNYSFRNFTSGVYVVRFEYGNTEQTIEFNGQDYENTAYQTGMTNKESHNASEQENCDALYQLGEDTLNNEWHDLGDNEAATKLENTRVSDARDYEPQRLRVIAYSRTITNSIAEVLASVEKGTTDENLEELIAGTSMVANTAKLNFEVERSSEIDYEKYNEDNQSIKVVKGISKVEIAEIEDTQTKTQQYYAKNIDFGIEERAQNSIQLDKYLKKIELTKENGTEVVLSVDINDDEEINYESETTVNAASILSLSQTDGVQGFKYITMESSYFDDLTVKLTYRIDVINESEVDWTSKTISELYTYEELTNLADEIEGSVDPSAGNSQYTSIARGEGVSYGEYAGYYYYTNKSIDGEVKNATKSQETESDIAYEDTVVTTTVDKLIDYIDTDISIDNSSASLQENRAWDTNFNYDGYDASDYITTLDGLISDESYTFVDGEIPRYYLQDNDGNLYISETRSNIAISTADAIEKRERPYIVYTRDTTTGAKQVDSTGWDHVNTEKSRTNAYGYKIEGETATTENIHNTSLAKELMPISYVENGAEKEENGEIGDIYIVTSVTVNSSQSADNMNYNNLAEILVYSNTVGRRTFMEENIDTEEHATIKSPSEGNISMIPGNANEIAKLDDSNNTSQGGGVWNAGHSSNPSKVSFDNLAEMDADAPEYVTFTEPTGIRYVDAERAQYMIIVLSIMGVLSLGIVGITIKIVIDKRKLLGEE